MAIETGLSWRVRLNTGTEASPTWEEITDVKEVTFDITQNAADTTTRSCSGWTRESATTRTLDAGFSILLDYTVSMHQTLVEAAQNQTKKGFKYIGGNGQNWILYGYLDCSFSPPVDNVVEATFTIHRNSVPVYSAS